MARFRIQLRAVSHHRDRPQSVLAVRLTAHDRLKPKLILRVLLVISAIAARGNRLCAQSAPRDTDSDHHRDQRECQEKPSFYTAASLWQRFVHKRSHCSAGRTRAWIGRNVILIAPTFYTIRGA
jgi:hypothetical protein